MIVLVALVDDCTSDSTGDVVAVARELELLCFVTELVVFDGAAAVVGCELVRVEMTEPEVRLRLEEMFLLSLVLLRDSWALDVNRVVEAGVELEGRVLALEVETRSTLTILEVELNLVCEAVSVGRRLDALVADVVPRGKGVPKAGESTVGIPSSGDSSGNGFPKGTG
jgi:hypothetical protein